MNTVLGEHRDTNLAKSFLFTQNPGRGNCYGDSGGPTYIREKNTWYIAGVLNGLPPQHFGKNATSCEDGVTLLTVPTYFKKWISRTSRVNFPEAASRDDTLFPEKRAVFKTLSEACHSTSLTLPQWWTVQQMLKSASNHSCAELSDYFNEPPKFL